MDIPIPIPTALEFPNIKAFIMNVIQSSLHSLYPTIIFISTIFCLFVTVVVSSYFFAPRINPPLTLPASQDHISQPNSPTRDRRYSLGSYLEFMISPVEVSEPVATGSDNFDDRTELYRRRRDDFRSNTDALKELAQWKQQNHSYNYKLL